MSSSIDKEGLLGTSGKKGQSGEGRGCERKRDV